MLGTIFSALNCGMFQVKTHNLQNHTDPTAFPLKHMTKDIKFIVDTAYELGAPVPAASTLLQLYQFGGSPGLRASEDVTPSPGNWST